MTSTEEKQTYNGWTNYATWNVKLWLDNEQGTYNDMLEMAEAAATVGILADMIEDYVNELRYLVLGAAADSASMFTDILNNTLGNVNWREIAEHYNQEHEEGLEIDRKANNQ